MANTENINETEFPKKNPLSMQIDLAKFAPATDEEKAQQEVMSESTTFFKDGMRKLLKNPLAVGSIIVLILVIAAAVAGPMIVPYGYEEMISVNGRRDKTAKNLGPFEWSKNEQKAIDSGEKLFPHILGTDEQCRDYFVRILYGTRVSLFIGFFAAILVLVIGLIYGSISGYAGGKVDMVEGTFLARLGSNMISLFIVFGLLYWVGMARLVRGQILSIKENEYILAARSIGAKPGRIIKKHILPNCLSVIIISTALQVPSAIFTESFLSFAGLGVQAPMPSLGSLANAARGGMMSYPHKLVFPAIVICLIVLAFNLLGDGLRDAFDPKLSR